MKKIAILFNTSWYIYNFRLNLIKELQKHSYEVITIAPLDRYTAKLEQNVSFPKFRSFKIRVDKTACVYVRINY